MSQNPAAIDSGAGDATDAARNGRPGPESATRLAWLLPWVLAVAGILLTLALSR